MALAGIGMIARVYRAMLEKCKGLLSLWMDGVNQTHRD